MSELSVVERRKELVLDAALELMQTVGLTVSMDDVARAAGVGRRTLFRYFDSRTALLTAAIARVYSQHDYRTYERLLVTGELEASLRAVFSSAYEIVEVAGQALWELARDEHSDDDLAGPARERRLVRQRDMAAFVTILWRAEGGEAKPPRWLVELFLLLEGSFAFYAWRLDSGASKKQMVDTATRAMAAAVRAARAAT